MRYPIEMEVSGKAASTADLIVKTDFIKSGGKICIQRVSATNKTTATKTVTIGLQVGADIRWLETITLTAAGLYYALTEPIFTTGNVRVVFRFDSPTSGDIVSGFVFGYYEC